MSDRMELLLISGVIINLGLNYSVLVCWFVLRCRYNCEFLVIVTIDVQVNDALNQTQSSLKFLR